MPIPANYQGLYNNGVSYALGQTVLTDGDPYGVAGRYFIRTGNPGNPGYPPEVGGATNGSWTMIVSKSIDGAGSFSGSGSIS
jgi:hypothetical protein